MNSSIENIEELKIFATPATLDIATENSVEITIPAIECLDLNKTTIVEKLTIPATANAATFRGLLRRIDCLPNISTCTVILDGVNLAQYSNLSLTEYAHHYYQPQKNKNIIVKQCPDIGGADVSYSFVSAYNTNAIDNIELEFPIKHFLPFIFSEDLLEINQSLNIVYNFDAIPARSSILYSFNDAANEVTGQPEHSRLEQLEYTACNFFARLITKENVVAPPRELMHLITQYSESGPMQKQYQHVASGVVSNIVIGYHGQKMDFADDNQAAYFPAIYSKAANFADTITSTRAAAFKQETVQVELEAETIIDKGPELSLVQQFNQITDEEIESNSAIAVLDTQFMNTLIQINMSGLTGVETSVCFVDTVPLQQEN